MDALASALPDRSEQDINWAYEFMLGAMVYVMADAGRIERLSNGLCRPEDEDVDGPVPGLVFDGRRPIRRRPGLRRSESPRRQRRRVEEKPTREE